MAPNTLPCAQDAAEWLAASVPCALRTDSRAVRAGDGFVAWPGHASDGRRFVPAALAVGAAACLVEADGVDAFAFDDPRIKALPALKAEAGAIAHAFYGQPSSRLDIVAATGTNGKTSTAWWVAQALTLLGRRCGVIGTLGVGEPGSTLRATGLTTPDAVMLHALLRDFVDNGLRACALEASSIGIVEHRLGGLRIAVALFTNFTRDHLDFHGTMADYWAAKRALFAWPGLRAAGLNIDDPRGAELAVALSAGRGVDVWTVSMLGAARLAARDVRHVEGGLAFDVVEGGHSVPVRTALIGDYNASNLLVVLAALRALGFSLADAAQALAKLTPVPGRMQRIAGADVEVVVDYAHTPDALDKVLAALRRLARERGGALWCVFGCGGNRDASKRPLMGAIAERGAEHVVVTSDNPRQEDPAVIVAQIVAGSAAREGVLAIVDRAEAIRYALQHAARADVVLIAGKGHEDTQDIAGVKHPFDDAEQARAALRERAR